jgi:uncharacterized protein
MGLVSALLSQLLAAYMVLVEPFLRTNFYRNLKKRLITDPSARLLFYSTQVLWELSWLVVLAVIVIPIPNPLERLGLTKPNLIGWIILLAILFGGVLLTYLLRRNPGAMASIQSRLQASSVVLPANAAERKWFAIAAVTAGICEELLYRGFLMSYLPANFSMLAGQLILISIISGIIYGLSRAYLGIRGIATTALIGFIYAIVYTLSGSILPAMVFHIMAELIAMWLWQTEVKANKAN